MPILILLLFRLFSENSDFLRQVAVVSADDRQMTYQELNDATDTLAAALRHRGVRPESIVGIYMERCLEYTVSYIAILKAGP